MAAHAEREFLRAMAVDDGRPTKVGELAERLGKSRSNALGPTRARLINKGIVYSPEHGMIAYTVPGMSDFVRRIDDDG